MAEIHVETKKNTGNATWLWIVLALVIIGAIVYYLVNRNKAATTATPTNNSTSAVQYFAGSKAAHLFQQSAFIVKTGNNILQPKALLS